MKYEILITIIIITSSYLVNTMIHEQAHIQIGKQHGCINYKVGIDHLGGYYNCLEYRERTPEVALQEKLLHGMNEIIGYTAQILLYGLYFLIIFYLTIKK